MDIYEDDIYLPEDRHPKDIEEKISFLPEDEIVEIDKEEIKAEKKPVNNGSDPGTRIIFQAPEKGQKRKFTGFQDGFDEEMTEIREEKPVRHEYKGGYAFEEEMKKKAAPPVRRPQPQQVTKKEKELSFEEEKRRRYAESLKKAELARKARAEAEKKKAMFEDSDMEEIDVDGEEKKTVGDIIRRMVIVIAVIAMAASIGVLVKQFLQKKEGTEWEEEVTGLLIDVNTETTKKKKDKDKNKNEPEETTERILTIEEQWAQLKSDYPNVVFPETLSLKYAKLYAVNQDFVGYLSVDEYGVSLPVVQSQKDTDKENYYLRRNFYQKYSVYGCPFVLKDNDMMNLDRNTVIYGHNNNSDLAFAPLNKYKTLEGYKNAPVIQFDTIYSLNKWKIVAAFITNTRPEDDNNYVFRYTFMKMQSDEDFMNYIRCIRERSIYDTGTDVLPTDKILTLSTCSHEFEDARFVVVARLVRPGETEDVNTSMAKNNDSPRYPQAYYDKKKKDNPYKDAEKWYYSEN